MSTIGAGQEAARKYLGGLIMCSGHDAFRFFALCGEKLMPIVDSFVFESSLVCYYLISDVDYRDPSAFGPGVSMQWSELSR